MNILIPMAGVGSRFEQAGYTDPKPFINVHGKYMVDVVLDNIMPSQINSNVVLVTKKEHNVRGRLGGRSYTILELEEDTLGTLDTIMRAKNELDPEVPLLIANCDQLIRFDVNDFINISKNVDGHIVTFTSCNSHHSYVTIDGDFIHSIVEKEVVSNNAVAGVYIFKSTKEFLKAAEKIISRDIKAKGEFYVSAAIDLMIREGKKFICYDSRSIMLGTPQELERHLNYE